MFRRARVAALAFAVLSAAPAFAQSLITVAGRATEAAFATSVAIETPASLAVDARGNAYWGEIQHRRVRSVSGTTGLISTVAGGLPYNGPDDVPATTTSVGFPSGVAVDREGNLFIADLGLRRVDAVTGIITTLMGPNGQGFSGDGGPVTLAQAGPIGSVAVDPSGNIFFVDHQNQRVRKITRETDIVTTVAGNGETGFSGDGGPATLASLNFLPGVGTSIAVDGSGHLFISDSGNHRIRMVHAGSGLITTFAGNGTSGFSGDGGPATGADLSLAAGGNTIAADAQGNVFIADVRNNRVRRVDSVTRTIQSIAGTDGKPYEPGPTPATSASLNGPRGVAVDPAGNVYVAEVYVVRKIDASGIMTTIAGTGPRGTGSAIGDGLPSTSVTFQSPWRLAFDRKGSFVFSDRNDSLLRRVDTSTTLVSTLGEYVCTPQGVAVDSLDTTFVAGLCHTVFAYRAGSSELVPFAGSTPGYTGDGGPATAALIANPDGLALDEGGNLFIVDATSEVVRRVAATDQTISTVADFRAVRGSSDIAVRAGSIYLPSWNTNRIYRFGPDGTMTAVAGAGGPRGFGGDGGPATDARFSNPLGIALDAAGNIFVADTANHRVRRVDATTGVVTTVAGNGSFEFSGDGLPATAASLPTPVGLAVDPAGNLFITSPRDGRIRAVFACGNLERPEVSSPADASTTPSNSVNLSWRPAKGAFSYDVLLDTSPVPTTVVASNVPYRTATPFWIPQGSISSTALANLLQKTTYYWRVIAKGDPNCPALASSSPIFSFTTPRTCAAPDPFAAVTPASGSTVNGSSTTLTWSAADGAGYYDVYFGDTSPPRLIRSTVRATSVDVSDLTPSTSYSWYVVAYAQCDTTRATASPIATFRTAGPCAQPGSVGLLAPPNGTTGVGTSLTLSWTPAANTASYDVYLGRTADPPLYQVGVTGTRLDVTGLGKGALHFWRVVAQSGCDAAKFTASPVGSFTVSGSCTAPAKPTLYAPPGQVAVGQSYVLVWSAVGLDAGGGYLVERSPSASFAPITESLITSSLSASFVAPRAGTYHHRVTAVAGCDALVRSVPSNAVALTAGDGVSSVIFTKPPQSIVTALGPSLDNAIDVADPEEQSRFFTIRNIGTKPVNAVVSTNTVSGSPLFFQVDDPQGSPVHLGVPLEPGESRQLHVTYSGIDPGKAASYQGLIYIFVAGQQIVPYAFVNLKVGGGTAVQPQFQVSGSSSEYAFFPPYGSRKDDRTREPLTSVTIRNDGSTPMELAAEIGPEVWLEADDGWNATPIPPGGSRRVTLRTRRIRALDGSALPRYTYFTVRTKDGATARLLVQDTDEVSSLQDQRTVLPQSVRSYIVPSVVTSATFVSKLKLTNAGTDDVPVELVFTPHDTDGFDASAVKTVTVVVPKSDVMALTDPLSQVFGYSSSTVFGQLEIRGDPAKLGLLSVTSSVEAPSTDGGAFGFQLPTLQRGEGAVTGSPQIIPGLTVSKDFRTNLILTETTGRDTATVKLSLLDREGVLLGQRSVSIPRYGQTQINGLAGLLPSGQSLGAGQLELEVESGGGAVAGVVTIIDNATNDAVTYVSQQMGAPATSVRSQLLRKAIARQERATPEYRQLVPALVNGYQAYPTDSRYTFRTLLGFTNLTKQPATFDLTYFDKTSGKSHRKTVVIPPRATREYPNALEDPTLFGLEPGTKSEGPLIVDSDRRGVFYAKVYSATAFGSLGDSFPVVPVLPVPSEALTGAGYSQLVFADGLEQSVDATRGTRSNLILNEVAGQPATVTIRLYEAGNREHPIAETDVAIAAGDKVQLSTVFRALGLDSDTARKDRTNVLCTVTPKEGAGIVAATITTIDNKTADIRTALLTPTGGLATSGGGASIGR